MKTKKIKKQLLVIISADKEIVVLAKDSGQFEIIGIMDPNNQAEASNYRILGSDEEWKRIHSKYPDLMAALALDPTNIKKKVALHYGIDSLATIISPYAYVSPSASISKGCLIQRGVKIMADARLGIGCKINVNATIHHDSSIGDFCTLAPGCMLLGKVCVGERVFIGAGAIILPKIRIGHGALVGAGAVVTKDVDAKCTVIGVPAKEYLKNKA